MKNLLYLCMILTLICFLSLFCSCSAPEIEDRELKTYSYEYSQQEMELLNLINDHRATLGLNKLTLNHYVSTKCLEHNDYMEKNNQASHSGFKERSDAIVEELSISKINENVAYNYKSSKSILAAWLISSGHRENVEGNSDQVGISIRGKYCTAIFIKYNNKTYSIGGLHWL